MDPIELSLATKADIPALISLEQRVAGAPTYSPMLEAEEWEDELRASVVYLVKKGDAAVGSLICEQKSPEHLYIGGIVVSPDYQGQGIGRAVLERVIAAHPLVRRFDLVTHPDNPALKLYESMGFKVEDRKEDYYGDGEPRLVLALER